MWSTPSNASKTSGRRRPCVSEMTPRRIPIWLLTQCQWLRHSAHEIRERPQYLGCLEVAVTIPLNFDLGELAAGALATHLRSVERLLLVRNDRVARSVKRDDRNLKAASSLELTHGSQRSGIGCEARDTGIQGDIV